MFKTVLILSNLIFSLILNVIFGEGVKVTQKAPDNVKPGDTFEIELVVNKTDVSGFAKIQQELPEGFTAVAVKSEGASFTFNDNKVKFIWMALPAQDNFTIKYQVTAGEYMSGTQIITGKFSYLYNNERKVVDLPIQKIVVGEESEPVAEATPSSDGTPVAQRQGETSAVRKVTELGDDKYQVVLTIVPNKIKGFAKVQEKLPAGVTAANGVDTKHSVFSFVDGQAKFVWMSLPEEKVINIKYVITAPGTSLEEVENTYGTFAFLENEKTRKINIAKYQKPVKEELVDENSTETTTDELADNTPQEDNQTATQESNPVAENNTSNANATENGQSEAVPEETGMINPEKETKKETSKNSTKKNTKKNTKSTKKSQNSGAVPPPENGLTYKVQICAGHNNVKVTPYFKSAFKFEEGPISVENHEGWVKYTIGSFPYYKTARNRRNVVTAGYELPEPFVTAYNDGNRITVQEALMISNQKWMQ